ncbi:MAG: FtsQ-type POTRA domain-containing protein [Corynebacterium sp.]|nr:FtsQ-type POTRA domain-containing protein [Corynebacterium sp.]
MNVPIRRLGLVALILCIVAGIAGAVIYFVPVFKVSGIDVHGNSHLSVEQVVDTAAIEPGTNLVRLNVEQVARNVASLPWVSSATVQRALPDRVDVIIEERKAVGFISAADGTHLIDEDGKEFVIDTPPQTAVEITENYDPADLSAPVEVIAALPEDVRAQVAAIAVEDPYSLRLWLEDGRNIFWGANVDNANKVQALKTVLGMEGDSWNISNPNLVSRP